MIKFALQPFRVLFGIFIYPRLRPSGLPRAVLWHAFSVLKMNTKQAPYNAPKINACHDGQNIPSTVLGFLDTLPSEADISDKSEEHKRNAEPHREIEWPLL